MRPGEWAPAGGQGASGLDAVPDVVGLELAAALERLKNWRYTLRFTAPPRPRGEKGAVRVIACRRSGPGQAMEVICAREYWDGPPGPDAGEDRETGGGPGSPAERGPTGAAADGGHGDG